jgi:type IV pilus modification protein PilV
MRKQLVETSTGGSRRQAGMTLVEVMVSLVVLAFGLLGVAALQVRAITESSGGQHLTTASAIARNRVEELSRLDWDATVLNDSGGTFSADTTLPVGDQTYARAERIADNVASPNETVKSIEVRVTWTDTKRQNRSVVLASARLKETDE